MVPCGAPHASTAAAWLQLGLDVQNGSPERARACFTDAARADPHAHAPPLHLGLLAMQAEPLAIAKATMHLRTAARLALAEHNVSAVAAALRGLGVAHETVGEWESAAAVYEDALSLVPRDCAASAGLANMRSAVGEHAKAAEVLRAALAEDHACPPAHHGLARLLTHLGDATGARRHAQAALELRPFDTAYETTLRALRDVAEPHAVLTDGTGALRHGAAASDPTATCGAPSGWVPPPLPADLTPSGSRCPAGRVRGFLLVNPFEEGCFHDDLRANVRQDYHSCGQFNNVLASLVHMLALSRLLCRTLVLPGFFIRFGARLTRVSAFAERWLPTEHFFNLTALRLGGFDVLEMHEWLPSGQARELPWLHCRAVGSGPPQLRFFAYHNLSFAAMRPAHFPHFLQQQSELRWVSDDASRHGYFSRFQAGFGAQWWRTTHGDEAPAAVAQVQASGASRAARGAAGAISNDEVLAFDAAPSVGMGMDHLRWDEALRYTRGHLRYVGLVHAEATRVRTALFGSAPFLAVHIRRGADRLHDFCHTAWGQRCFGWNITMDMCYPSTEAVAAQIAAARDQWGIAPANIFLATDSPRPELFEDLLRERHGLSFARYGQPSSQPVADTTSAAAASSTDAGVTSTQRRYGPPPTLGEEFALPVDQSICAAAPYFLGNVPSTVTATIVQERDSVGWGRERTTFFGFGEPELGQFRRGWEPSDAFAAHYVAHGSGCMPGIAP